jgi:hypothetical protein
MILRTGAIYTIFYQRWKTNYKIYLFCLWPGGGMTKTHGLNLGANQLNIMERAKIVRTIVRLSQIPQSTKYNGRLLYKILKTYLPNEIKKCYRTYFTNYIQKAALINYGLNKEEEFSDLELNGQAKDLYEKAQRDFQVKAMNLYSKRGYKMDAVKSTLAGDTPKTDTQSGISGIKSGTRSATRPTTGQQYNNAIEKIKKPLTSKDIDNSNDDGNEFGY